MKNKGSKLLLVLTIICLSVGIAGLLFGTIIEFVVDNKTGGIVMGIGSLFEIVALVLIIVRAIKFGFPPVPDYQEKPVKEVKTVDVKPIKETEEEKLYKQYENLYKEGLISKEDLEKKRTELLGK